jgi:hypothetical protein
MSLAFIMPCYREPPLQVAWAVARVIHHNPGCRVVVVQDGDFMGSTALAEKLPGVVVTQLPGGPYKRWQYGGTWVHKLLARALEHGGDFDYVVKLDPDTMVCRPVVGIPDGAYCGTLAPRPAAPGGKVLTHAAVAMRRDLIQYLVTGRELLDPKLRVSDVAISKGSPIVSEEIVVARVAERLPVVLTPWPVVCHCAMLRPKPLGDDIIFAHSVLPFEPPRAKNFLPAAWFTEMLDRERGWLREHHPHLLDEGTTK